MSLKKFLLKHSGELGSLANILGGVVSALPIDKQDKRNMGAAVTDLITASENIAKSAKKIVDTPVKIDEKILRAAVEAMLPQIVEQVAAKVFEISTRANQDDGK